MEDHVEGRRSTQIAYMKHVDGGSRIGEHMEGTRGGRNTWSEHEEGNTWRGNTWRRIRGEKRKEGSRNTWR